MFRESLSHGIHGVDILTCTTFLDIIADQVRHLTATPLPIVRPQPPTGKGASPDSKYHLGPAQGT